MNTQDIFRKNLRAHIIAHPLLMPADIVKFCYQAALGASHLMKDRKAAEEYFRIEFENTPAAERPLYEELSGSFRRADLAAWKYAGRTADELLALFLSQTPPEDGEARLKDYLAAAEEIIGEGIFPGFSRDDWLSYKNRWLAAGAQSVHHSMPYRENYSPSYRVIARG